MSIDAVRFYFDAIQARKDARSTLHSGLPGRVIYFKLAMRRAIRKWRQYSEIVRAGQ